MPADGSVTITFRRGKLEYWKDQLGFMTNAIAAETSMRQKKRSCLRSKSCASREDKWTGFKEELKWEMGGQRVGCS